MNIKALEPFGCLISPVEERGVMDLGKVELQRLLAEHKLLLIRQLPTMDEVDYLRFAEAFGDALHWEFGPILNLRIDPEPANHIFSNARVELHWDGAFVDKEPRLNFFQCLNGASQGGGGETLFVDTTRVLDEADDGERDGWRQQVIHYRVEKKAHYGGVITRSLVARNPHSGDEVLRYIESFNEDSAELNPMEVAVEGLGEEDSEVFLRSMNARLYSSRFMYRHRWQSGDIMIADNSYLLHGRSGFHSVSSQRHIQRINIL